MDDAAVDDLARETTLQMISAALTGVLDRDPSPMIEVMRELARKVPSGRDLLVVETKMLPCFAEAVGRLVQRYAIQAGKDPWEAWRVVALNMSKASGQDDVS
jgi:hypothetical protein